MQDISIKSLHHSISILTTLYINKNPYASIYDVFLLYVYACSILSSQETSVAYLSCIFSVVTDIVKYLIPTCQNPIILLTYEVVLKTSSSLPNLSIIWDSSVVFVWIPQFSWPYNKDKTLNILCTKEIHVLPLHFWILCDISAQTLYFYAYQNPSLNLKLKVITFSTSLLKTQC